MPTNFEDVGLFHKKFGLPYHGDGRDEPQELSINIRMFRATFLLEEVTEFAQACQRGDLPAAADAMIDFAYVAYGTLHLANFNEVASFCPFPEKKGSSRFLAQDDTALSVREMLHGASGLLIKNDNLYHSYYTIGSIAYRVRNTALIRMGLPWQDLWDEVQRANMAKERGPTDKRGHSLDVRKPLGWEPPDIEGVLRRHGWDG